MLTVQVRSTAAGVRTPSVTYLPGNGTKPVSLYGRSKRATLIGADGKPPKKGELKTKGRRPLTLSIAFAVPAEDSPSALAGALRVSIEGGEPAELPVRGEARTYEGVTVTPKSLPIDSANGGAELALEGPELIEYLRSHGGETLQTILYGDDGHTARAELTLPTLRQARRETEEDEKATGQTSSGFRTTPEVGLLDPEPAAGKYAGKLVLPGLPSEAGSVDVALHAHDCPWLLFLIVLLGIVLTGIGSRLVTTAARRKRLKKVLEQTHAAYLHIRETGEKTRSWRLEDLLAEDTGGGGAEWGWWRRLGGWLRGEETERVTRLQGLPALEASIATARSSKDLDEDAERVLDMVARMQRWLRLEPVARRLTALAAEKPKGKLKPSGGAKLKWKATNTVRDTWVLLEMARREPKDSEKADDLVARLLFQMNWHTTMIALWDGVACGTTPPKVVQALDQALGDTSKAESRTIEEQDDLAAKLDREWRIHFKHRRPPEPPSIDEHTGECGITPVEWGASANLFTGWATLDEPSYGQLKSRAATSARTTYLPKPADLRHEIGLLSGADIAWTLAILAGASAAYTATTYSDTWGGWAAFASAFLAGALGKVTVNWAALPIFQSIRLRKAKAS